jgi:hypothetical protein
VSADEWPHVVLVEERAAGGVEPDREEHSERVAPCGPQRVGRRRERERVPADDAEEELVVGRRAVLQGDPVAERAEVVA